MPKASRETTGSKRRTTPAKTKKATKPAKPTKAAPAVSQAQREIAAEILPANKSTTGKAVKSKSRLPSVWQLVKGAIQLVRLQPKPLLGITAVYGLLVLILVQSFSAGDSVATLKSQFAPGFLRHANVLTSSVTVFGSMLGSVGNSVSGAAGAYQFFLLIIGSLAIIWAFRQIAELQATRVSVKQAYYRGMTQLIPFVLVIMVIGLEMVPFLLGATVYSAFVTQGIAVGLTENLIFISVFVVLAVLSLFLMSTTFLALYAVAEPEITPRPAMLAARALVRGHRLAVFRKVLFLPFAVLLAGLVIMVPAIAILPAIAPWLYFILSVLALLAVHAYMYTLYRELQREAA